MSHVNVTIHGRQYRMACEDGQEDHLRKLAKDLDARIEHLKKSFGAIGDMRLIVMAALTIADELSDTARRRRRLGEDH
jgi:cell division protein ZapA